MALQFHAKTPIARLGHVQRDACSALASAALRFQPVGQTLVEDGWLIFPEGRRKIAVDVEVAQKKFDAGPGRRKMAADIVLTYMKSNESAVS